MPTLILNEFVERRFKEERSAAGLSERDEVWDGVDVIMPLPNTEHQKLVGFFMQAFLPLAAADPTMILLPGSNVSDRIVGWEHDFREPDFVMYWEGGNVRDCGTHLYGGPDFLLEILSPQDQARDKLPFYAAIGTREALLIDRDPWQLELYQLRRGKLHLAGAAKPGDGKALASNVVPLTFNLVRGKPRPKIRITHTETDQKWTF